MIVFKNEPRKLKRWKDIIEEQACEKDNIFYVLLPHPITIEMTWNGEHVSFTVDCVLEDKKTGRMYWGNAVTNGTDHPSFKFYDYNKNEFDISPLSIISKHEPQKFWTEII